MIRKWLKENKRNSTSYYFNIIDFEEIQDVDEDILSYLGEIILASYRSKEDLKRQFKDKPEIELKDYLAKYVFPNIDEFLEEKKNQIRKNVMQGDFGEILTSEIVKKFRNLHIPLLKMRLKINNNKSVFCTDILAHNLGNKITDLTYYEVKTRISNKKENKHYIPYNAAQSLIKDQEADNAESIADFLQRYYNLMAAVAFEAGNGDLAEQYLSLADKYSDIVLNAENYNKHFEVVLIMEKEKYSDEVLDDLEGLNFTCGDLCITILLFENVKNLYLTAFEHAYEYAKEYVYGMR